MDEKNFILPYARRPKNYKQEKSSKRQDTHQFFFFFQIRQSFAKELCHTQRGEDAEEEQKL